ncbi:Relaxin receptor 1 [Halotydeus destructor]|nr:Relaxin receptor 1 [Halotydeus destructor]
MFAPRVRVCRPHNDGLSSTQHLLFHQILKKSVWLVALVTCSGNIIVFAWRSISTKEDAILALFVQNLSAADFLMGIYLLAIGLNDLAYEGNYSQHALQWMSSWQCSFIGFLAMLSSELSVLIVTLITIERYRCITANFRVVTPPSAKINLIAAWMLSSLMAAYPLLHWSTTGHNVFYGSSGLCFPLHIDDPFTTGWEYSAVVFLGINFPAVMIIIYLYIRMFLTIKADRKLSRPFCQETKREDAVLAARLFFIVFTDCLCWLPIIVIKIIAFLEYPINPAINAWLIVFVLPVNSALNPIIYTLAAPTELHRKLYKNIRNSFRIMKCQFVFSPRPSNCKQANEQVFSSSSTDTSNQTRSSRISSNGSVVLSMATINTNGTQAPFSLVYNSRTAPLTA